MEFASNDLRLTMFFKSAFTEIIFCLLFDWNFVVIILNKEAFFHYDLVHQILVTVLKKLTMYLKMFFFCLSFLYQKGNFMKKYFY